MPYKLKTELEVVYYMETKECTIEDQNGEEWTIRIAESSKGTDLIILTDNGWESITDRELRDWIYNDLPEEEIQQKHMNNENIKYKDPFLGEILLTRISQVILDSFFNTESYYLAVDEKIRKRGLAAGVYVRNDETGKIKFLSGDQIEMIAKIYDKLTRLD